MKSERYWENVTREPSGQVRALTLAAVGESLRPSGSSIDTLWASSILTAVFHEASQASRLGVCVIAEASGRGQAHAVAPIPPGMTSRLPRKGGCGSPGSGASVYCVLRARFGRSRRLPGYERRAHPTTDPRVRDPGPLRAGRSLD